METYLNDKLTTQHRELIDLVKDLDGTFLLKRHRTGKWSIHENIAHLARYQEHFAARIHEILQKETPMMARYKAETDPGFEEWLRKDTGQVLEAYAVNRTSLCHRIDQLTTTQINRTGVHPKLGALKLYEWIQFFLLHESHHIYTIYWLVHEYLSGRNQ